MASIVELCNIALGHIGNKGMVTSVFPPDGSVESRACNGRYATARDEMLGMFDWDFARTRTALAAVTNNNPNWAYAYTIPSTCMVPRRVLPSTVTANEQESEKYAIEGSVLYTNKEEAVLVFTQFFTDINKFTVGFRTALALQLAGHLAGPIIRLGDGVKASRELFNAARAAGAEAQATNANSSNVVTQVYPSSLAARHGRTPPVGSSNEYTNYPNGYVVN